MLLTEEQLCVTPPLVTTPSQITQTSSDIEVLEAALWRLSHNYSWLDIEPNEYDSAQALFLKERIQEFRNTFHVQGDIVYRGIMLCKQAETSQIEIAEATGITLAIELASAILKEELSRESL